MITRRPNHTPALPAPLPLRGSSGQRLPITRRLIVIRGYSVPCTSSYVQYIPPQGSAVLEFGSRIWGPLPTTHYPLLYPADCQARLLATYTFLPQCTYFSPLQTMVAAKIPSQRARDPCFAALPPVREPLPAHNRQLHIPPTLAVHLKGQRIHTASKRNTETRSCPLSTD